MGKVKIRIKRPWIAYPGSTIQQSFGESVNDHGFLLWNIKNKENFSVDFHRLSNPCPFVTLAWDGNNKKLLKEASKYPPGSRFRIRSNEQMSQKDVRLVTDSLREHLKAVDISFKAEAKLDESVVAAGDVELSKEDLTTITAQMALMKEYYKSTDISDKEWKKIKGVVEKYLQRITASDALHHNVKWSIKRLEFDNLFAYGEDNVIDFDKIEGITGIFGRNKIGKSSLIGALMYTLYNASDRGPINSFDIVNENKDYSKGRAVITVNGSDYVVERKTVKQYNKKVPAGATTLELYRVEPDGTQTNLKGDDRNDTDKKLRKMIGTSDDFLFTSMSSQGDMTRFIKEGATQRKLILSKFLGLDIFELLHDMAKEDFADYKATMKNLKQINWDDTLAELNKKLETDQAELDRLVGLIEGKQNALASEQMKLASMANVETITTEADVENQKSIVREHERRLREEKERQTTLQTQIKDLTEKLSKATTLQGKFDVQELKKKIDAQRKIETAINNVKHQYQKELLVLSQQEKSAKRLLEVPCGDNYPTCKFISDSHQDKAKIADQKKKVEELLASAEQLEGTLEDVTELEQNLNRIEQVNELINKLKLQISANELKVQQAENSVENIAQVLEREQTKFLRLSEALENTESSNAAEIKNEISNLKADIAVFERQKIRAAQELGRAEQALTTKLEEKTKYDETLANYRLYELITLAFSKKGIPNLVINRQLPVINHEIANIMHGLFDFNVELESDVDSNAMDVFMNIGGKKRPIENGSGMEKMVTSLVIRVALANISSLPKTNFFVIDEGFGVLDPYNIEACNRLLVSLKRFYRNILIITHTDAIKETVDNIIEVVRQDGNSKVTLQ